VWLRMNVYVSRSSIPESIVQLRCVRHIAAIVDVVLRESVFVISGLKELYVTDRHRCVRECPNVLLMEYVMRESVDVWTDGPVWSVMKVCVCGSVGESE